MSNTSKTLFVFAGVAVVVALIFLLLKNIAPAVILFIVALVLAIMGGMYIFAKVGNDEPKEAAPVKAVVPIKRLPERIVQDGVKYDARYHRGYIGFDCVRPVPPMTPVQFRLSEDRVDMFADGEICGSFTHQLYHDMIRDFSRRKEPFAGQIDGEDPATLELAFYKRHAEIEDYEKCKVDSRVFTLCGTGQFDYEPFASCVYEGKELDVAFDAENDRYETEAGFLPDSANDFLGDDTVGFVTSVDEHDNGRIVIKLRVFERRL